MNRKAQRSGTAVLVNDCATTCTFGQARRDATITAE